MAQDDRPARASAADATPFTAPFTVMLRGSLPPTVVAGVLAVVLAAVAGSGKDAGSAALGAVLVVVFFSLSLLVMRRTAHLQPVAVMSVVLATYTAKILALGVAMVLLRDADWIAGRTLALTIIGCTLVWLAFEMRAFTRLRILVAPAVAVPDDRRPR